MTTDAGTNREFPTHRPYGGRIPFDTPEESTILQDSLVAGYRICSWFQPFVSVTGSTALAEGKVGR